MGMKDQFDRAGNNFKIPLDKVILAPNARRTFIEETIAVLANLLMLQGQREAGKGYLHDDGEHFVVTAGQRRYKAMMYANENLGGSFEYIKCDLEEKVNGKPPEGKELKIRQMVDGTSQEKLCIEDQAATIKELVEIDGMTVAEVAKSLGCSDQHVRDMLKFESVPEHLKAAVKDKKMSPTTAIKTARATEEAQREVEDKINRGERVTGKDVEAVDGKLHTLSVEEIQQQIKKADKIMLSEKSEKGRLKWAGVKIGLRIALRLDEKLK